MDFLMSVAGKPGTEQGSQIIHSGVPECIHHEIWKGRHLGLCWFASGFVRLHLSQLVRLGHPVRCKGRLGLSFMCPSWHKHGSVRVLNDPGRVTLLLPGFRFSFILRGLLPCPMCIAFRLGPVFRFIGSRLVFPFICVGRLLCIICVRFVFSFISVGLLSPFSLGVALEGKNVGRSPGLRDSARAAATDGAPNC